MNNNQKALIIVDGLLTSISALFELAAAAKEYSALVNRAIAEGRDISDDELNLLAAQNDAAVADLLKKLEGTN